MDNPFVSFSLSEQNQLVIKHHRDPRKNNVFTMEIPLEQLASKGFDSAATAIGMVTLGLLSKWYKQQFKEFSVLKPPEDTVPD